jgi:hypothetical protein
LLRESVVKGAALPGILEVKENIDIAMLDPNHVLPNMDDPTVRGVWFPKGYSSK